MRVAIMQPYFLPYFGYFQLMKKADIFVVYDNIEYTKKGWINRNRILVNGKDEFITLPIKKDSDYLHVKDRFLSDTWESDRIKMLNKIKECYRKAPYFSDVFPIIEGIIMFESINLFDFILNSILSISDYLNIQTKIIVSSDIPIDHSLKSESKVISICNYLQANTYINPIGGVDLYSPVSFKKHGLCLEFLEKTDFTYKQFDHVFIPYLSIIDVMMFNPLEDIKIIC